MAATVVITIPLAGTRTLSVANDKIEEVAGLNGVHRSNYTTDEAFADALMEHVVNTNKRGTIQGRNRENSQSTNVDDLITET